MREPDPKPEEFSLEAFIFALVASAAGGVLMSFLFAPPNRDVRTFEIVAFGAIGGVLIGLPFMYVERLAGSFIDGIPNGGMRIVARSLAYMTAALIGFGLSFPIAGLVVFGVVITLPFGRGLLIPALVATVIAFGIYAYGLLRSRLEASLERIKEQEFAEKELELARKIQQRLLPPPEIDGDGYRIVARNIAATYVAGDFYDVFHLEDGSLGVAVADVAGKGMGASLIMSTAKAMLPLIASKLPVAETLCELNERLRKDLDRREFVALVYARFDPQRGRLEIANAGLPNPYLIEKERIREVDVAGPRVPLGMMKNVQYESVTVELDDRARLLLYSDGLPEAPLGGENQLGYETLQEILSSEHDDDPGAWIDRVLEDVLARTPNGPDDDCTALVLERRSR